MIKCVNKMTVINKKIYKIIVQEFAFKMPLNYRYHPCKYIPMIPFLHHLAFDISEMASRMVADCHFKLVGGAPHG